MGKGISRNQILIIRLGEKLRERLDRLEALAASAVPSRVIEALAASAVPSRAIEESPAAGTDPSEVVTAHGSSSTPTHLITQSLPPFDASDGSVSSSSAVTPGEFQHLTPQSDDNPSALSMWDFTASVDPSFLICDKYNDVSDVAVFSSSVATSEEFQHLISQSDNSPSALSIWDSTTSIDPSLLICDKHNDGPGLYSTTTIDCGCSTPHVQVRTRGPDPFGHGEIKTLSFGPSVTTADPYANNLRIETVCVTAALYNLGLYIGVTEETICADKSPSPFFWSSVESADDMAKASVVCTVQRMFKTLKPDLRPSSEQITVDHHPYIDVLPFPTLRKNLITHQERIDEDGFFHDVLTGLVCWGGAGIGRKDRQNATGDASTGTPWDVRSWEAKVWFLKKYWNLLGGEDGELVRQSEWWRSMRGDDTVEIGSA